MFWPFRRKSKSPPEPLPDVGSVWQLEPFWGPVEVLRVTDTGIRVGDHNRGKLTTYWWWTHDEWRSKKHKRLYRTTPKEPRND